MVLSAADLTNQLEKVMNASSTTDARSNVSTDQEEGPSSAPKC